MVEIILQGKVKLPENKQQLFIQEFSKLLQIIEGEYHGIIQQGYTIEDAEIIEEIIEGV
jgi:hypothetical protein